MKRTDELEAIAPDERVEAEQTVLGGVLCFPDELDVVAEILRPEDFGNVEHRLIFKAMLDVVQSGRPLDVIELLADLRLAKVVEAVGGPAYLSVLGTKVPSSMSILTRHANRVRDASTRRRLVGTAATVMKLARDESLTTDEAMDGAQAEMLALLEQRSAGALVQVKEPIYSAFREIQSAFEHYQAHGSAPVGLSTGFTKLDEATNGLHGGDLVIIAARPGAGKTGFVMNLAAHVAIRGKRPVAVFSLEMGKGALLKRVISSEARVDHRRLQNGALGERDWAKLASAHAAIGQSPMHIDDSGCLTVFDVRSRCRRLKSQAKDLGLVVIDYLQLMTGGSERTDNREQEISSISRGLKSLARELDCPVVALSQLSRAVEKRSDKRPLLSDLRESGAIEQDADTIGFIYRDEYYDEGSKDKGVAEFIIGKQRNGPTGTIRLRFDKELVRFDNLEERW